MTDSLRAALIEAGAVALHEHVAKREGWANKSFDAIPEVAQGVYRDWSAELVGVYLGVLADRADEWVLQSWDYYSAERHEWVPRLLAVLRDDIEPEEDA